MLAQDAAAGLVVVGGQSGAGLTCPTIWRISRPAACLQVAQVGDALAASAAVEGGSAGIIVDLFADGQLIPQLTQVSSNLGAEPAHCGWHDRLHGSILTEGAGGQLHLTGSIVPTWNISCRACVLPAAIYWMADAVPCDIILSRSCCGKRAYTATCISHDSQAFFYQTRKAQQWHPCVACSRLCGRVYDSAWVLGAG